MMSGLFQFLAIDTIHETTTNPRRTFDEAKLYELAESIKRNGRGKTALAIAFDVGEQAGSMLGSPQG